MKITIVREENFDLNNPQERKALIAFLASDPEAQLEALPLVKSGRMVGSVLNLNGEELARNEVEGLQNNLVFAELVQAVEQAKARQQGVASKEASMLNRGPLSKQDIEYMHSAHSQGVSFAEIAATLNRKADTVKKMLGV